MESPSNSDCTPHFDGEELSITQPKSVEPDTLSPCHPSDAATLPPSSSPDAPKDLKPSSRPPSPTKATPSPPNGLPNIFVGPVLSTNVREHIDAETEDHFNPERFSAFKPPFGFIRKDIPKKREGRSIAYDTGVTVEGIGEFEGKEKWYCLVSNWKSVIAVGKNKSNITDHLRSRHKLESKRTKKMVQARVQFKTKLSKERLAFSRMEPCRYHHVNVAKFGIHQMLPFQFVESAQFRTTIQMLDQRNEFDSPLYSRTFKKIILEMYLETTNQIKQRLKSVASSTGISYVHLNADLWTSRVSADKYFGVRIFFIDETWNLHSFLLAIRRFRPHPSLLLPSAKNKLSDILYLWTERILGEFGVSTDSLLSEVTDSGSDVKRLCSVLLPGEWDWCLSHLCNCAVNEAFSTGLRKDNCKNIEARTLIEQVRKVVEHLHKSQKMRARFEELQREMEGKAVKLLQDQAHRWLGTVRLMERVLLLWDFICVHYHRVELRPFPVEHQHKLLLELFSVMKPVAEIMVSAQSSNTVTAIDTFLAVCNLYPTILDDTAPLPIRDPAISGYKAGKPIRLEQPASLELITQKTRRLLRAALVKRFYKSYNGTTRSLCYEMQVFLHPPYRKLSCLDRFIEPEGADSVRRDVKNKLYEFALRVAKHKASATDPIIEPSQAEPHAKKQKTDPSNAGVGIWNFSSFEELGDAALTVRRTVEQDVMEEIDRYLADEKVKAFDLPSRRSLTWWKKRTANYPNLSVVARCILAHPASSAAIERDFGVAEHTCRHPELPTMNDGWMEHIPNRFTGVEPLESLAIIAEEDDDRNTDLTVPVDNNDVHDDGY